MVLSLFAGVGARSAKAAATLTATPASGTFAGGVAAVTAAKATATITLDGTFVVGNTVTVGWQDTALALHTATATATGTTPTIVASDLVTAINAVVPGTAANTAPALTLPAFGVTLSQDAVGIAGNGKGFTATTNSAAGTVMPAAGTFAGGVALAAAATATASFTLSGTPAVGIVATVTWTDPAARTATYTLIAADTTLTAVAIKLVAAINAVVLGTAANTGAVVTLTQPVANTGIAGNDETFAATATTVLSPPAGTVTLAMPTQPATTTNVLLGWTYSAADATSFNIYRNQTGVAPTWATDAPMAAVASTVLAFTDTTTAANQLYYYWVRAINVDGGVSSASKSIITTAAVPVVVPVVGATTALTVTSSGAFTGGVDGIGVAPVDAVGTVTALVDSTHVTVDVTTAGVGMFGGPGNVTLTKYIPLTTTSTSAGWATLGQQYITFTAGTLPIVGDEVTVTASTTNGVGTVLMLGATVGGLTTDLVNVTTAKIGTLAGVVTVMRESPAIITSTDPDWLTVGTANITFADASLLAVDDGLYVTMAQLQAAQKAYAYLTLNGAVSGANITAGTVATATWQDTTGASHTASYTVLAGDSLATVITKFINAINATAGGLVTAAPYGTSSIKLTQTVKGAVGNGKTLTAGTTAAATALTILTLGGLGQPAYVEVGKTIQLVAVDSTGAIVAPVWTLGTGAPATINSNGLLRAMTDSGVTLVTATSGSLTGTFVIVNIPTQTITKLTVILVPATLKVAGKQQFGAIAASSGYSALDYTTQAAWTDTLPVGVISNAAPTQGLLTYSTAETGDISALAAGLTSTATATIDATGVVTVKAVPVTVTKVIVLTVGTDIVTVDGKATSVDAAPEIVNGRTFVPIRFIAETFGSTVTWLPETKGVTIVLGDTTIGLQIGNATAVINTNVITLEAAPYIKNSRTMVPLRVISESFGGDVVWDAALRTITITYVVPAPVPVPAA
jgi:hypothetical protein